MSIILDATPREILAMAREAVGSPNLPARLHAAALLGRQALEAAVHEVWLWKRISMERVSMRAQLLCVGEFIGDAKLGGRAHHAWARLSDICHHEAYELGTAEAELGALLETVGAFIAATD